MPHILGVDFDNTIADYGRVFHQLALRQGLIPPAVAQDKNSIREHLRSLPEGELLWQKLQGEAYGPGIYGAKLIDGVRTFLEDCSRKGCRVYIVSHKTEFAHHDETGTNLREAALEWMTRHRFFEEAGMDLHQEDVYFEPTRQDKVRRIRELGCTHVVDDLEETFLEGGFPSKAMKILYNPGGAKPGISGVKSARNWQEITEYVFDGRD